MLVTQVKADMRGIFYCPSCNALNGSLGLAKHGIDYEGEKAPDNQRLGYCEKCGHPVEVLYPDGGILPHNKSYGREVCEHCHGDYKHAGDGGSPCDYCDEGGHWIELEASPPETIEP